MTVSPNERFTGLKQALFGYLDEIARIQREYPNLAPQQPLFFTFLTFPWLVDMEVLTEEQRAYQDRLKLQLAEAGFDGQRAKAILNEVLAKDLQLRECCLTPLQLAGYLDAQFLASALDMTRHGAGRERLEFAFENFESATYGQRFRRIALSHLFNIDMQSDSLVFKGNRPLGDIRIERLNPRAIPPILGETDLQGFLHVGIG